MFRLWKSSIIVLKTEIFSTFDLWELYLFFFNLLWNKDPEGKNTWFAWDKILLVNKHWRMFIHASNQEMQIKAMVRNILLFGLAKTRAWLQWNCYISDCFCYCKLHNFFFAKQFSNIYLETMKIFLSLTLIIKLLGFNLVNICFFNSVKCYKIFNGVL